MIEHPKTWCQTSSTISLAMAVTSLMLRWNAADCSPELLRDEVFATAIYSQSFILVVGILPNLTGAELILG
jgi:hypothetical protein